MVSSNIHFTESINYPTVLLHGIASSKSELNTMKDYLISQNMEVYNMEIGNGFLDSISMNMNKQCSIFAENIKNLNISTDQKINLIGISQGGLTTRCYVEKYSHLPQYNSVNSLITMGSPHMGYWNKDLNIKKLEYWKNPFDYNNYLLNNDYLVFLNNEKEHENSIIYKNNIESLEHFIMVWSNIDEVIMPLESAKFEFYNIEKVEKNNELVIQPFYLSNTYLNNSIGLKTLYNTNKLMFLNYDCEHQKFKTSECFINIFEIIYNDIKLLL